MTQIINFLKLKSLQKSDQNDHILDVIQTKHKIKEKNNEKVEEEKKKRERKRI